MATGDVDTQAQYNRTGIENVQTSQNNVQVLIVRKCSRNIVGRVFLAKKGVPTNNREGVPNSRNPPGPFFQLPPHGLP